MRDTLMAYGSFIGGWLLVLGAILQAALELRAHELARDRIEATASRLPPLPRISPWWWLIPPVHVVLGRRRSQRFQRMYMEALSFEDYAALLAFVNKATGWLVVSLGAWTLATIQTLGFAHARGFGAVVWMVLLCVMPLSCIFVCVALLKRGDAMLTKKQKAAPSRA